MTPDLVTDGGAPPTPASGYVAAGYMEAFERAALMLAAIVIAISAIVLPPQTAYSVTVGAALAALNAMSFHRVGMRLARTKSPMLLVVVFQLKLLVLIGVIAIAMFYFGVEGVPLMFGISVLPVSLLLAGLFRKKSASNEDSHG